MSRPLRAAVPVAALIWGSLCGVVVLVAAVSVWSVSASRAPGASAPESPVSVHMPDGLGDVPRFTLVDQTGNDVGLDDLRGRWWVADFIFTRCATICPLLSSRMAALIGSIPDLDRGDVRFVSFTVDPEHDTPEVLARFAGGYPVPDHAPGLWMFLTGPRETIHALVGEGFRLTLVDEGEITHSDRFVLVDPRGRIRGYYHGTDEDSVRRLAEDLQRLRSGR